MGILTPQQYNDLLEALVDAFDSRARLARMVKLRLGVSLNRISEAEELDQVSFSLIGEAERLVLGG